MNMDANTYSLGTRRKETDNPVLIFWIRKINQHSHSMQTDRANKIDPVGFHSVSSFSSILEFQVYSKIIASKLIEIPANYRMSCIYSELVSCH